MTASKFSQRPSSLIYLNPESETALNFDLACSLRLIRHENKRDADRLRILIKSIGAMLGVKISDPEPDDSNAEEW